MKLQQLSKLKYCTGWLALAVFLGIMLVTSVMLDWNNPLLNPNTHKPSLKSDIKTYSPGDKFTSPTSYLVHNEQSSSPTEYRRLNASKYIKRFPVYRSNLNRTMKILLYTPWIGDPNWSQKNDLTRPFRTCPFPRCVLTKDKSDIDNVDALLFHTSDYWNGGKVYPMPKYRRWDQIYILQNAESPPHTGFKDTVYNRVFNWTQYYRRDADIVAPYFKIEKRKTRRSDIGDIAATKTKGIAWVASNCHDSAKRQLVIKEMQKYIQVDTYGGCGKMPLPRHKTKEVLIKYKFYLAFENSLCRDYLTEKFANAVLRQNIPVIQGGDYYKTLVPPNSYIDVSQFKSVKEAVDYLKYLDKNNTAFNSYFEWTKDQELIADYSRWCSLCRALHDETRPAQVYTDLVGFMRDDACIKKSPDRKMTTIQ